METVKDALGASVCDFKDLPGYAESVKLGSQFYDLRFYTD